MREDIRKKAKLRVDCEKTLIRTVTFNRYMLTEELGIDRERISLPRHGYGYFVKSQGRPEGDARIYFFSLGNLRRSPFRQLCSVLEVEGLQSNNIVAGLVNFYPNGRKVCRQYMRQGVGSRLLERIIQDLKEQDAQALFLATRTPTMISFVEKKGFKYVADTILGTEFYLLL